MLIARATRLALAILISILAAPQVGFADEPADTTIIVTARRATERTQDVPLNVSTVSADDVGTGAVDALQSLASQMPGLSFEAAWGGYNSFPVLRGQSQPSIAGDNVGIFIDGVYQANRDAVDAMPLDLERIEVVRGPQSALFGHSSFAGLISYVPAQPTEQALIRASTEIGTDDLYGSSATVSGPLDHLFKARLAVSYRSAGGTYDNDARPRQRHGSTERLALAASISTRENFGPLSAQLSARYGETNSNQPAFFTLDYHNYNCGGRDVASGAWSYFCGEAPIVTQVALSPDIPDSRTRSGQVALHLAYELGGVELLSDTSYYRAKANTFRDFDGSATGDLYGVCQIGLNCTGIGALTIPVLRLERVNIVNERVLSVREIAQELRIRTTGGRRFNWQIGATLFRTWSRRNDAVGASRGNLAGDESYSSLVLADMQRVGRPAFINRALVEDPNTSQVARNDVEERWRTIALFGAGDYALNDRLRLHGEIRVNWEQLVLDSRLSNLTPSFGTSLGAQNFRSATPRISLDYRPADGWLVYTSYARGARSGGINPIPGLIPEEQTFEPETNWTTEIGLKFAGSGLVHSAWAAAYDIDWSNTQILSFSTTPGIRELIRRNTVGIHTQGIELGGDLTLANWLELDLAYSYANPRFKQGSEDPGSGIVCGLALGVTTSSFCTIRPSAILPGQLVPDISGNRPARAAKTSWTTGLTISPHLSALPGLRIHSDISHQGDVFDRQIGGFYYGARTLVGARASLPIGPCTLELWGTNLTNEHYVRIVVGRGPVFYPEMPRPIDLTLGDGRRIGLSLRYML